MTTGSRKFIWGIQSLNGNNIMMVVVMMMMMMTMVNMVNMVKMMKMMRMMRMTIYNRMENLIWEIQSLNSKTLNITIQVDHLQI